MAEVSNMPEPIAITGYWPDIATEDKSASYENATIESPNGSPESSGHSDKNEDSGSSSSSSDGLRFNENMYKKDETSHVETGESSELAGEVVEEEIVELEFEKVKPKLDTHSMHCPNCKSEITKVVLRRKVITSRRPESPVVEPAVEPQPDPKELVGCLSCLSLFTFSGNGCFNPFDIFRKNTETKPQTTVDGTTTGVTENENCFSMFFTFKKQKVTETVAVPAQTDPVNVDRDFIIPDQPTVPKYVTGKGSISKGQHSPLPPSSVVTTNDEVTSDVVDNSKAKKGSLGGHRAPSPDQLPPSSKPPLDDDTTIDVVEEPTE